MRTLTCLLSCLFGLSAPLAAHATATNNACHWRDTALPEHARIIDAADSAVAQLTAADTGDAETTQLRALLQRPARPLGRIEGRWKVRSLQFTRRVGDTAQVFAYPFFNAQIDRNPCGYHLAKTSGSQRRSGQLYSTERPHTLAFLGASTVNAQSPRDYEPQRPAEEQWPGEANSAGYLYRTGPDDLVLVLDVSDGDFEVYHFKR